jgi:hypothetical protein
MESRMITRDQWRNFKQSKLARMILFATGVVLLILAPVVGAIPGPGGLFFFAAGMALTLQNSDWAKRQYVRFKRWQPKAGAWMDWGLRRRSAKRRDKLRKARDETDAGEHGGRTDRAGPEGQTN